MYDAGAPLFAKECIRGVGQQLREVGEKGKKKISVTGIDGVVVDFDVQTGTVVETDDPELEHLLQAPVIAYHPGPLLVEPLWASIQPESMYCSLRIMHSGIIRNKSTKEVVSSGPIRLQEDDEKSFQDHLEAWKKSDTWKQLESSLLAAMTSSLGITKIIGLGCGPISTAANEYLAERSLFQHALLLTVRHLLAEKSGNTSEIQCYAQDPEYSNINKTVLGKSGITILDDPEAFLEADGSSVVFSCAPNVPVRQIVSDTTHPAIMIWDNIKKEKQIKIEGEVVEMADPVSPRLREMIRNMYDELEFPEDRHFGDLAVYVRRPA